MRKFKPFLYLLFNLFWLPLANAQYNWTNAGKADSSFEDAVKPTMLISVTGQKYLEYANFADPNTSSIAMDESNVWQKLPNVTGTYATLSPFDGTLYQAGIAQQDGNGVQKNQIIISQLAWGKWQAINTNGIISSSNNFQLILSNRDDLYLAYSDATDGNQLVVKRYDYPSQSWQIVGGTEFQGGVITSIVVSQDEKTVYVACSKSLPDGTPVILKSVNNSSWQEVGNSVLSVSVSQVALALDANDNLFIAYKARPDYSYNYYKLMVKRLVNNQWQDIGNINQNFDSIYSEPGLVIDNQGKIFVSYDGNLNSHIISVIEYTDNAWQTIGSFSNALWPSLALTSNDTLYLSYTSNFYGATPKVVVKKGTEQ
jgi:hypothetical protein